MKQAINNVAGILADEYMKQGRNVDFKENKKMAKNGKLVELENVLLDQIEKLNDDSICEDMDQARIMVERSRAISELTKNFTELQRTKLDIVRHAEMNGGLYEKYLGIE